MAKVSPTAPETTMKDRVIQERVATLDEQLRAENLRKAFDAIDVDKSDTIDIHELGVYARAEGYRLTDKQVRKIFKDADGDGDPRSMSFPEFCAVMDGLDAGAGLEQVLGGFMRKLMAWQKAVRPLFKVMAEANTHKSGSHAQWRIGLGEWIDGTSVQMVVLSLLVIDVLAVACELLLTATKCSEATVTTSADLATQPWSGALSAPGLGQALQFVQGREGSCYSCERKQYDWYLHIGWVSKSILLAFAVQILGSMVAYGGEFFRNKFYVADFMVVAISIGLEFSLKGKQGGLLVLLISWRCLRIVHGLFSTFEIEVHEIDRKLFLVHHSHHNNQEDSFEELRKVIHDDNEKLIEFRQKLLDEQAEDTADESALGCSLTQQLKKSESVEQLRELGLGAIMRKQNAEVHYMAAMAKILDHETRLNELFRELESKRAEQTGQHEHHTPQVERHGTFKGRRGTGTRVGPDG